MARLRSELLHERLQRLDFYRRRRYRLPRWNRDRAAVRRQRVLVSAGLLRLCAALAPVPRDHHHGLPGGALRRGHPADVRSGERVLPILHGGHHTLWARSAGGIHLRLADRDHHHRIRRHRPALLHAGRIVGGSGRRFSAGGHPDAVLSGVGECGPGPGGGLSGLYHALPAHMVSLRLPGQYGWVYVVSWALMVSVGYNTSAMAQRYFSVDHERSAKKVALLCFALFLVGAFIWFIPPMAMRVIYPDLATVMPGFANPHEAAFAAATLTLLPNGLIGIMLAAMFSSAMASLSGLFNMHAGIISKDVYQTLFAKNASERKMLLVGRITTVCVAAIVTVLAVLFAVLGKSIFQVMVTIAATQTVVIL